MSIDIHEYEKSMLSNEMPLIFRWIAGFSNWRPQQSHRVWSCHRIWRHNMLKFLGWYGRRRTLSTNWLKWRNGHICCTKHQFCSWNFRHRLHRIGIKPDFLPSSLLWPVWHLPLFTRCRSHLPYISQFHKWNRYGFRGYKINASPGRRTVT